MVIGEEDWRSAWKASWGSRAIQAIGRVPAWPPYHVPVLHWSRAENGRRWNDGGNPLKLLGRGSWRPLGEISRQASRYQSSVGWAEAEGLPDTPIRNHMFVMQAVDGVRCRHRGGERGAVRRALGVEMRMLKSRGGFSGWCLVHAVTLHQDSGPHPVRIRPGGKRRERQGT